MKHVNHFIGLAILMIAIMATSAIAGSQPSNLPNGGEPSDRPLFQFIHGQEALEHGDHGLGIINGDDDWDHRDPPGAPPLERKEPKKKKRASLRDLLVWIFGI